MAKTKKSNTIEFHSVANIFPMMTGKEFEALKQDILTNGLKEPIWLYEGKIIDGRNRYLACLETGTSQYSENTTATNPI
jgi:ParB-like chromosome segregation protein Spo0J